MNDHQYIRVDLDGPVGHIRLNRPEKHHALNIAMIRELQNAIKTLEQNTALRLITLAAPGKHFCAGADLEWMASGMEQTPEKLKTESLELAGLFKQIADTKKHFICAVQGRAMGGAIGLVAAADLVLAEESARFAFSEVKLGLLPATIAPYVLKKAGRERSRAWMLSGRSFSAQEAREGGLVHLLCPEGSLKEESEKLIADLLENEEEAMAGVDQMLNTLESLEEDAVMEYTARLIAGYRSSEQGLKRMKAFLERNSIKPSDGR